MSRPKTPWYTRCRRAQEQWKATSATLPDPARPPGETWVEGRSGRELVGPFPVCLPLAHTDHNLLAEVRDQAIARFAHHDIAWHHGATAPDGTPWPSGHLLDSQVQCVNTLLSLARHPDALLAFARTAEPEASDLVVVEDDSPVAFEWGGHVDHLGERRGRPYQRGRFTTSIDALLVAARNHGGRTAVLVEWKFTESYHHPVRFRGRGGTDRREVYRERYEAPSSPFSVRPPIEACFHEPHYQLLRQVLLAQAVVEAGELGVDRAVVLHAVPRDNRHLLSTVPEGLAPYGGTVPEVWGALVGGGRVSWRWLDTTPWTTATEALAERYGSCTRRVTP